MYFSLFLFLDCYKTWLLVCFFIKKLRKERETLSFFCLPHSSSAKNQLGKGEVLHNTLFLAQGKKNRQIKLNLCDEVILDRELGTKMLLGERGIEWWWLTRLGTPPSKVGSGSGSGFRTVPEPFPAPPGAPWGAKKWSKKHLFFEPLLGRHLDSFSVPQRRLLEPSEAPKSRQKWSPGVLFVTFLV